MATIVRDRGGLGGAWLALLAAAGLAVAFGAEKALAAGQDLILEIDWQGAAQVRGALPEWAQEPADWRAKWRTLEVEPGKWRIAGLNNANPISPSFKTEQEAEAWADKESATSTSQAPAVAAPVRSEPDAEGWTSTPTVIGGQPTGGTTHTNGTGIIRETKHDDHDQVSRGTHSVLRRLGRDRHPGRGQGAGAQLQAGR